MHISISKGHNKKGRSTTEFKIVMEEKSEERHKPKKRHRNQGSSANANVGKDSPEVIDLDDSDDDDGVVASKKPKNLDQDEKEKAKPIKREATVEVVQSESLKPAPAKPKVPQRQTVSIALDELLSTCQASLTAAEYEGVSKNLSRRKSKLPEWYLYEAKLAHFVAGKHASIKEDAGNTFVYIKDLVDEFKRCTAVKPTTVVKKEDEKPEVKEECAEKNPKKEENLDPQPGTSQQARMEDALLQSAMVKKEETKEEVKAKAAKKTTASKGHIKKLEKTLKRVQKEIERLETKEVDFDNEDEEDDTYDLLCRYKRKAVQIYKKIAEFKGLEHRSLGRKQDKKFK